MCAHEQELLDVQESIVPDAPQNSIDLKTADRLYTVAADTESEMVYL